jgi:hypothetical protein
MRKNIVLANDTKEVPKLQTLVDEVCEAMEFDEKTSMQMRVAKWSNIIIETNRK